MAGVTLIELIVTLAIAVILLSIAVPSFQSAMRTNRIAALTNELSGALQLARSEAVTRGRQVTVCKSDDVSDDTPTCNASASWQNGWLVFADDNQNSTFDAGERPLRVGQPSAGTAVIASGGTDATNFANYVSFTPTGQAKGSSTTHPNEGTLTICIAPDQRSIVINTVGRLHIAKGTCT
jgi:type IV fimbrial biogenesis protein FimT